MEIKVSNIKNILMFLFAMLFFVGYEQNVYSNIGLIINIISVPVFLILFLFLNNGNINKIDPTPILIIFIAYSTSIIALFFRLNLGIANSYFELLKNTLILFNVIGVALLFDREDTRNFLKYCFYVTFILSLLGIVILIFGEFLFWSKINLRLASIINDPNYYGIIAGYGCLYSLLFVKNIKIRYCTFFILLINLLFSFSKGSIISFVLSCLYIVFKRFPLFVSLLISITSVIAVYIGYLLMNNSLIFDLLRIETGLNRRDIYWSEGFKKILEHPFIGYGTDNITQLVYSLGYTNVSLHNYYIEQAYINGIIFFMCIVFLILLSLIKLNKSDHKMCALLLYFVFGANNFSYAVGGVGIISILFTFTLLYAYQRNVKINDCK